MPPTIRPSISHSGLHKTPIRTVDYGKGSHQPSPQPWDSIIFSGGQEYGLSVHVIDEPGETVPFSPRLLHASVYSGGLYGD